LPKTRYTVLPASEDSIILHSFDLMQYWHVTDRQTEMLRLIHSAALPCALKIDW